MCLALLIGLTAATVRAAPAPAPSASLDIAAIDAYVDAQMRELRIPGLALGIVQARRSSISRASASLTQAGARSHRRHPS
jgi:CubicO group peptidase (beta-lactamase class C family)